MVWQAIGLGEWSRTPRGLMLQTSLMGSKRVAGSLCAPWVMTKRTHGRLIRGLFLNPSTGTDSTYCVPASGWTRRDRNNFSRSRLGDRCLWNFFCCCWLLPASGAGERCCTLLQLVDTANAYPQVFKANGWTLSGINLFDSSPVLGHMPLKTLGGKFLPRQHHPNALHLGRLHDPFGRLRCAWCGPDILSGSRPLAWVISHAGLALIAKRSLSLSQIEHLRHFPYELIPGGVLWFLHLALLRLLEEENGKTTRTSPFMSSGQGMSIW